jgi:20S proteasome alpha/beta subunit
VTVAIGLVCKDGVLAASDSMGSDQMTAHKAIKVHALDHCPVVWTASGSVYVMEEVAAKMAGFDKPNENDGGPPKQFREPNLPVLRQTLFAAINPAMLKCYQSALASTPFEAGRTNADFMTSFLILGYSNETPWFLEFAQDGQVNWHTDPRFYAVGSGGSFATVAHGLMAHYLSEPLTLNDAKKVAYRAIETTCEVSSMYVGMPVQIAVVDKDGPKVLTEDEVNEVGDAVARWKELEAETLRMGSDAASAAAQGDLPSMGDDAGSAERADAAINAGDAAAPGPAAG